MNKKRNLSFILSFLFLNCSLIYPTTNPIDSFHFITGKNQSKNLIVMLPGRGDRPDDFNKNGFIESIINSGVDSDVIIIDAHVGYYYNRNLIPRLYEDVIVPYRLKGYKNIWMLGISIGGTGTLLYTQQHPGSLSGIILLAPFLGDNEIINEINISGGLKKWTPEEPVSVDDYQRLLWDWLKKYSNPGHNLPKIILGYGRDDKFAFSNKLLSEVLPGNQVYESEGDHDWVTWNRLFNRFLKDNFLYQK
ncbi:MAG: alpha/beta hydrolase [Spirochaetes bacterium]|nr:alpha/beta hydrolase [Spirochaetota bacterium]